MRGIVVVAPEQRSKDLEQEIRRSGVFFFEKQEKQNLPIS
jgi:hypothetical protein